MAHMTQKALERAASAFYMQGDSLQTKNIIKKLVATQFDVSRPNRHQLKVGPYNFYHGKGTIYRDGDKCKIAARGIDAFIRIIKEPIKADVGDCKPDDADAFAIDLPQFD